MKRIILTALVTAAVLIPTSAYASAQWSHTSNGIWCKTSGVNTLCIPTNATGYGVGISRDAVMIYDINRHRSVCQRYQH